MIENVREIWAVDADVALLAPLISRYPNHATAGDWNNYAFSSQLDVVSPSSVYDKIDYKALDMTGEELYNATKAALFDGFKGGQQYTKAQIDLMLAYDFIINPPDEASE